MDLTWRHADVLNGAADGRAHVRPNGTSSLAYGRDFFHPGGVADDLINLGLVVAGALDEHGDLPLALTDRGREELNRWR